MATLDVHNMQGEKVGTYDIEPADLAARISRQLLHDAVVMYQANLRQGTHKTKSRSEVSASTKKLFRQKGTGNARAGARSSGIRRGGGHIHAIRPRDYSYRMPRKALRLATRMALAAKIQDDEVLVVDRLAVESPSTKTMAAALAALGCQGKRVLVATDAYDVNVYKSGRNIPAVRVLPCSDLNALELLHAHRVVITRDALDGMRNGNDGASASTSVGDEPVAEASVAEESVAAAADEES